MDERYARDPGMIFREINGETILVPVRSTVSIQGSIFTLNDTAAFAWSCLDGDRSLAEIRDELVAEFEVSPQEAEQDLMDLMQQLQEIGAVILQA